MRVKIASGLSSIKSVEGRSPITIESYGRDFHVARLVPLPHVHHLLKDLP